MHVFRITFRGVKLDSPLTERGCERNGERRSGGGAERTSHAIIWAKNVLLNWITSYTGETLDYFNICGSHLKES